MSVPFDVEAFIGYLTSARLLQGAWTTVWLTAAAMAVGLVLAVAAGLAQVYGSVVVRLIARFYVWLFQGTPLLIQLIIIFVGLPQVGIRLNVVQSAIIGLGLNRGAYLAEVVRGGLLSVHHGQIEGARALGMTRTQVITKVVGPQAFRVIVPIVGNEVNGTLKYSSLAAVISMEELTRRAQIMMQVQLHVLEVLAAASVLYLILTTLWGLIQRQIERAVSRGDVSQDSVRRRSAPWKRAVRA